MTLAMESVTDKDRADLAEAVRLAEEAKALRRRVKTRIRNRRYRKNMEGRTNGQS